MLATLLACDNGFCISMAAKNILMLVGGGNLVTARAWPAHPEWLAQFLRVLGTKIEP
jgi:protease I